MSRNITIVCTKNRTKSRTLGRNISVEIDYCSCQQILGHPPLPSLYFFLFLELITIRLLLKQYMYSKTVILDAISSYFSCHSFRKAALQTSIPKSTLHFWVSKLRSFFDHNFKKRHALHRRTKKREQIYLAVSHELQKQPFYTLKTLRETLRSPLSLSSVARVIRDLGSLERRLLGKSSRSLLRNITSR